MPFRMVVMIIVLALWVVVCWVIWPLGVLLGAGPAIDLCVGMLTSRISALLAGVDQAGEERDPADATDDDGGVSAPRRGGTTPRAGQAIV